MGMVTYRGGIWHGNDITALTGGCSASDLIQARLTTPTILLKWHLVSGDGRSLSMAAGNQTARVVF